MNTILGYWLSESQKRYPTLPKFACSILAIPTSSVPSECIFSRSGRVLSDYRKSLNSDTVKALMLLGDWLRSENKY